MNFENQGVIKRLSDQYGPENLTVVLGNGEANGVEVFAETVTQGDPSYAGPLAGVALKIPVYHVLEEEVMRQVPEKLREEFQLSPFYTKVVILGDFPIVASAKVNDAALSEASVIVQSIHANTPSITGEPVTLVDQPTLANLSGSLVAITRHTAS